MGILDYPKIMEDLYPIYICRLLILAFEVYLFLWLDEEVELLVRLSLVDRLCIPEPNEAICTRADDLLIVVSNELNRAVMAGLFRGYGDD